MGNAQYLKFKKINRVIETAVGKISSFFIFSGGSYFFFFFVLRSCVQVCTTLSDGRCDNKMAAVSQVKGTRYKLGFFFLFFPCSSCGKCKRAHQGSIHRQKVCTISLITQSDSTLSALPTPPLPPHLILNFFFKENIKKEDSYHRKKEKKNNGTLSTNRTTNCLAKYTHTHTPLFLMFIRKRVCKAGG